MCLAAVACCRYLEWDASAQIALIKIWLAEKMELTPADVRRLLQDADRQPQLLLHCHLATASSPHKQHGSNDPKSAQESCDQKQQHDSDGSDCLSHTDLPCTSTPPPLQVEQRLAELGNLLPDIVGKLDRARADVLYELLKDPAATAQRLLALRELLPRCNVSALVAGHPKLMLGLTVSCCCCCCTEQDVDTG